MREVTAFIGDSDRARRAMTRLVNRDRVMRKKTFGVDGIVYVYTLRPVQWD